MTGGESTVRHLSMRFVSMGEHRTAPLPVIIGTDDALLFGDHARRILAGLCRWSEFDDIERILRDVLTEAQKVG
ncbi:hypothetical protein [Actinomadura madurae]|uniref:hypothetical protein n=1 Tax=Actinomadura madurae TaxID=1993 RepID=UPI002027155A|nr:hypothetical protein [Actinomadura madurae]MCP9955704.1 hypothetical protein [Actinomadura madurae]MCP9972436.1 hypothetical protein [Actinomadura madurae]MCP9984948.1 hypothetical protein [Actinomadura madurae]MCQ0003493.1 hypothetical protein [Actinomadura madurae]MCQ0021144.1 hypothetical protein [Actinomadura madurae]